MNDIGEQCLRTIHDGYLQPKVTSNVGGSKENERVNEHRFANHLRLMIVYHHNQQKWLAIVGITGVLRRIRNSHHQPWRMARAMVNFHRYGSSA